MKLTAPSSVAGGQATKAGTNDKSDDKGGVNNQTHNQTKAADTRASKADSSTQTGATGKTDSKGSTDTSSGAVQVAGAVGVAVAITHSERSEEHTSELQSHVNLVCRL